MRGLLRSQLSCSCATTDHGIPLVVHDPLGIGGVEVFRQPATDSRFAILRNGHRLDMDGDQLCRAADEAVVTRWGNVTVLLVRGDLGRGTSYSHSCYLMFTLKRDAAICAGSLSTRIMSFDAEGREYETEAVYAFNHMHTATGELASTFAVTTTGFVVDAEGRDLGPVAITFSSACTPIDQLAVALRRDDPDGRPMT